MPRFFTDNITENKAIITGDDAKHIGKVLRAKTGERVIVCDGRGYDYECEISEISDNIILNVLKKYPNDTEPSVRVHLFQALPKSDKMEYIIQKAVELGVNEITPVLTSRCISRPDESKMKKKTARWNAISETAAKQCGRGIIPIVHDIVSYKQAVETASSSETAIIFYENGGERINSIVKSDVKEISVFVGCEGGFEQSEVDFAVASGIKPATLGKRILRCETAPICALSVIMNITENI